MGALFILVAKKLVAQNFNFSLWYFCDLCGHFVNFDIDTLSNFLWEFPRILYGNTLEYYCTEKYKPVAVSKLEMTRYICNSEDSAIVHTVLFGGILNSENDYFSGIFYS